MPNNKPVNHLINPLSILRRHIDVIILLGSCPHGHNITPPVASDCGIQWKVAMILTEDSEVVLLSVLVHCDFCVMDMRLDVSMIK